MKKKRILIIEDDYDLSALMIRHLQSADYDVLNVGDAIQGVQFARREAPDLIVLDLNIPGGGGLKVLENIGRLPETQSIPVIVLTGIHDPETKEKVLASGAIEYLEKPYNPQELLRSIDEHIVEPEAGEEEEGSAGKILIVDDDIDFVKKLSLDLHRANFSTVIAYDVDQGMRLAREEKPDLIILDLRLPGGGGFTFYKNLKSLVYAKNIPVIVLTALKDEEYKKNMMEAGVKYYLEKPYDLSLLLNAVEVAM
jgi:DNA-binding response OmpR family regulator